MPLWRLRVAQRGTDFLASPVVYGDDSVRRGEPVLGTASLAAHIGDQLTSVGTHALRGLVQPVDLYRVTAL